MKKIYLYIFIIIFILAAAGTFVFFYLRSRSNKETISPTPSLTTVTSTTPIKVSSLPSPNITETTTIKLFFIAVDDNGKSGKLVGCGDSAVSVTKDIPKTQAVLAAAMKEIVSIKEDHYGQSGLDNALANSNLTFQSANIDSQGKATIKYSGNLQLAGTCEDPRLKAQLEETARQFPSVKSVEILINNTNLNDLISTKG